MTESKELTAQHQMVWSAIRTLPDGERILGRQLRDMAGIKEERDFYRIIEELRQYAYFIGASRSTPRGYYEIRTTHEMVNFIERRRAELYREMSMLDFFERKWFRTVIPNYMEADDIDDEGAVVNE